MALDTAANHLSFWITACFICLGSCSVNLLKPNSHGLTPLTHLVDKDTAKGLNLPEEFLSLSRRKRNSPEYSSGAASGLATEFEFKDDGDYVAFIHWSGKNSKVVFFFTCGRANKTKDGQFFCDSIKSFRSTDYGETFKSEDKKFKGHIITGVEFCAQDNNKVIASSIMNETLFISNDEGETYVQHPTNFKPYIVSCNPGKDSNVLAAYDVSTSKLYTSEREPPVFSSALSENVNKFFWDPRAVGDPQIYLEVIVNKDMYLSDLRTVVLKPGVKPSDVKPFVKSLGNFTKDSLQVEGNYIFVKKHTDSIGLYVYSMRNSTFFQKAIFPSNLSEREYIVVDTSEDEVLVAVRHQKEDPVLNKLVSNLYISGISGSKYVLSLENVLTVNRVQYNQRMTVIDIHKVKSSKGIYMANIILKKRIKSVITFNKGGKWDLITPPQVDQHGQPLYCEAPECSLHIHMAVSKTFRYISEVVSSPSAVGLIIAQGNIGSGLQSNIGLFFSRDEGITWQKVLDGFYDFAIGDHGGIVVAVPMMVNTTTVWYSCTEGISWQNVTFGDVGYLVFAVLTEPGDTTRVFDVFGHYSQSEEFQWLVVKLDFGSVLSQRCTARDYTLWSPSDEHPGTECLLGQRTVFERRKADVCCYNGGNYSREINQTACVCDMDDYQCDVGFVPEELSGICMVPDKKNVVPEICPEGHNYLHSSGYRKVPGDMCHGGVEDTLRPEVKPCPVKAPAGLQIEVANVLPAGEENDLHLTQEMGSRMSAQYVWDFGDKTPVVNRTGFENAEHLKHTFASHGRYNVSVTAKNKAGEDYTRFTVKVIDPIKKIVIEPPHGVVVGQPAVFNVSLYSAHPSSGSEFGFTHFIWKFGDETKPEPLLSLDQITEYTFGKTGRYSVGVEGFNAVSRANDAVDVFVYEALTMVRLQFDNEGGEELTRSIRVWFAQQLQKLLAKLLKLSTDRLEVVVLPGLPTNADVSIIPANSSDTVGTEKAVKALIDNVRNGRVVVPLLNGDSVTALHAEEIAEYVPSASITPPSAAPGGKDTRLAIAVGVAAALLLTFLGLVVFYFYRRYKRLEQRYSRLQQHDQEPLLRDPDSEDDDGLTRAQRPGSIRYAPLREADRHLSETDEELLSDLNTGPLVVMSGERAAATNDENAVVT